jgi:hypothetical protein
MGYIPTYGKHNKKTLTQDDMVSVTADIIGLRAIFTGYCLHIIAASILNREYRREYR